MLTIKLETNIKIPAKNVRYLQLLLRTDLPLFIPDKSDNL